MSEDFDKYLAIANHDIQTANNMGELKSYVASILYDNDKKAELLQQKENIIKEVREYIESYGITKEQLKKMSFGSVAPISIGEMLNILEILDKENK